MTHIPEETIEIAVTLLGADDLDDEAREIQIKTLTNGDAMAARRLIDWIPEAFGLAKAAALAPRAMLPRTFQAKDKTGHWFAFDLGLDPVFVTASAIARRLRRDGPEDIFSSIAARSSIMRAVLSTQASGASLEGAVINGPAFGDIPAETYSPKYNAVFANPRSLRARIVIIIAAAILGVPLSDILYKPFAAELRGSLAALPAGLLILGVIWAYFTTVLFCLVIFREKPCSRLPASIGWGLLLTVAWLVAWLSLAAVLNQLFPHPTGVSF